MSCLVEEVVMYYLSAVNQRMLLLVMVGGAPPELLTLWLWCALPEVCFCAYGDV